MKAVKSAFRPEVVRLKLSALVASKDINPRERKHAKFQQIAASLTAVGLIEPLIVFPTGSGYRVLDGNKRLDVLRERKFEEVECLIATADEAYNYNRRVNYLSTIGEHQMILRALRHNTAETIAKALNVDVSTIRKKQFMLDGICKEAVDVLKARRISSRVFAVLRKMKPVRQLAAAQLMVASNAYSQNFALALLAGTSDEMLIQSRQTRSNSLSGEQRARLVAETDSVLADLKTVELRYGEDALVLSVCCRYLDKLLSRKSISCYLQSRHPGVGDELQSLVASYLQESANGPSAKRR